MPLFSILQLVKYMILAFGVLLLLCFVAFLTVALVKIVKEKKSLAWFISGGATFFLGVVCMLVFLFVPFCNHEWSTATCLNPMTCYNCGATRGNLAEHRYLDATCTTPRHCSVCSVRVGSALGHTPGEWKITGGDYVNAIAEEEQSCTVCGMAVDTRTVELTELYKDGLFILSPEDFVLRMNNAFAELNLRFDTNISAELSDGIDGDLLCSIYAGSQFMGTLMFNDADNEFIPYTDAAMPGFMNMMGICDVDTDAAMETFVVTTVAMIMTFDPLMTADSAAALAGELATNEALVHNGIDYTLIFTDEGGLVIIAPA